MREQVMMFLRHHYADVFPMEGTNSTITVRLDNHVAQLDAATGVIETDYTPLREQLNTLLGLIGKTIRPLSAGDYC